MASIQRRLSRAGVPSFRVMYRIDGHQTSDTFADGQAAADYSELVDRVGGQTARAIRMARTNAATEGRKVPTLQAWMEHYLVHLTGATAGTVAEYRRLAKRTWMPQLGALPVDALDKDSVRRWVGVQAKTVTRRGTLTSAKTIENAHGLLSQVVAGAVEAGYRPDNPCRGVKLPTTEQEEMVFLSEAEFATLVGHVPVYWHPLVLTLAGTGMRWGEATALRWGDLDLDADEPYLLVSRAWKRGATTRVLGAPKTRRSRRRISLPEQVVDKLRPLHGRADELVFVGKRGGTVHHQAFHPRVWIPAVEKADLGKKPRIHDLRHSHASWLIAAGVDPLTIQRRLGHESIKTTMDVYGHLMGDAQGRAAAAATRALASAFPVLEPPDEPPLAALA